MVNCTASCIKYVFYVFNFICFIIGVTMLGSGIYIVAADYPTEIPVGQMILYATSVSYVLIFVGFIITPAALSACYGAIIKKTWILTGFSILMLVFLVSQFSAGLYGLINYDLFLERGMQKTLNAVKKQPGLINAWEVIQRNYGCCGINQPSDWEPILHNKSLPMSCCPDDWLAPSAKIIKECTIHEATWIGCEGKLVQHVKEHVLVWMALGFAAFILVQFVVISFTYIMSRAYLRRDRRMHSIEDSLRYG